MYSINEEKMFYDMADNQAIVINFQTGVYYGMSSLASAVIDIVLQGATLEAVCAALKKREGCPADIEERVQGFFAKLVQNEIVVEHEGESVNAPEVSFGPAAFDDGYAFDLDAYAEAQDLILADPIHEVDVNAGWPILKEE